MNVASMAELIHAYQRFCSMTDPLRYSCTVPAIQASGGVFGMNFEKMFSLSQEEQAPWFLQQQKQADLLRRLMAGQPVSEEDFFRGFGFSLGAVQAAMRDCSPIVEPIPDKLVVLTFDDAIRDQYETALPILKRMGFHATFFIAEMPDSPRGPGFADKSRYMTWDQIHALQDEGFELGNHTKNHVFGLQDMGRDKLIAETRGMEEEFRRHGIAAPVSFAYPSGMANSDAVASLRSCGYLWGRGNCETGVCGMRGMSVYDPMVDSPLAMPNFGDPDFYTEELMRERIALAAGGRILGLTYHSVSPGHWPGACSFPRQMELLAEEGCTVIAMRDLARYIDPRKADRFNPA